MRADIYDLLRPGRRREVIRPLMAGRKSFRPGTTFAEVGALLLSLLSLVLALLGAFYLLKRPFG